jgi:nitroreductase
MGAAAEDPLPADADLFDVVHARRSVRRFTSAPVPEEQLRQILDAARMAPTSGNQQPWKFLVVRSPEKIRELTQACIERRMAYFLRHQDPEATEQEQAEQRRQATAYYEGFLSAPVYVVVLTDNESRWPTYNIHDGPLAAGYLMLAARALGYGTVYATDSVPEDVTREVFKIPERYTRVCLTPIGVPESWPDTPLKRPLEEFIVHESF